MELFKKIDSKEDIYIIKSQSPLILKMLVSEI